MDQASRLDWDVRSRKAVRDEPVGLGDHNRGLGLNRVFLAITFYWPIAMLVAAACTAQASIGCPGVLNDLATGGLGWAGAWPGAMARRACSEAGGRAVVL